MADDPITQDEINRLNECLNKCRDDATGVSNIIYDFLQAQKIPPNHAVSKLNECSRVHDACCDRCVPHRRHFTDSEKEDFRLSADAEAVAGGAIALAGIFVAAVATGPIGQVAGGFVIVLGSAVIGMGVKDTVLHFCPIDPNFSKVPVLSIPRLQAVRPVRNSGLSSSVARAANAVLANQAEAIGLLNALITALDRSDGAAKAGDASAEQRQLDAARDFAKKVSGVIKNSASLRLALAAKWKGPGLDVSISERDALKLRDDTIINGFPSTFLDQFKKLGIDRNDRDIALQRVIIELAKLQSFRSFRDLLVDPKWRAAELQLASALTQFSRS